MIPDSVSDLLFMKGEKAMLKVAREKGYIMSSVYRLESSDYHYNMFES